MNNEILFRLFCYGLNLHRSLCVGCLLQAGTQVVNITKLGVVSIYVTFRQNNLIASSNKGMSKNYFNL